MTVGILVDFGKAIAAVKSSLISIDLDVNLEETHEWTNDVTSNPVERGVQITDHIRPLSDKVSITGMISNSGISEDALQAIENEFDMVESTFDLLHKIKEDGKLVTVYTKYAIYEDMAIQSISIPRSSALGDSINFSMQFIAVRIVDTKTVDVPRGISRKLDKKEGGEKSPVAKKTEPQKHAGATATKEPEKSTGILSKITGFGK